AFQELSSLRMPVTAIDLIATAGSAVRVFPPASSPGATTTMDLVSLGTSQPIIAIAEVPANTFDGARIAFQDLTGTNRSGAVQTVTAPGNTMQINFAEPVTVTNDSISRILLDF